MGGYFIAAEEMGLNFEERTEKRLNDHADRIRYLETNDARQTVIIEELCKKSSDSSMVDEYLDWQNSVFFELATFRFLYGR